MKQESFEDQLKNKSEQFSMAPKAGLWEAVEAGLVPEKRKRRVPVFWLLAGVLTIGIAYWMVGTPEEKTLAAVEKTKESMITHTDEVKEIDTISKSGKTPSAVISNDPKEEVHFAQQPVFGIEAKKIWSNKEGNMPEIQDKNTLVSEPEKKTAQLAEVQAPKGQDTEIKPQVEQLEAPVVTDTTVLADVAKPDVDTTVKSFAVPALPKQPVRFYAGVVFAPLQSYSILKLAHPGSQSSADYTNRSVSDKALYGYKTGVTLGFENGRHSLYSGLLYSRMGYRMLLNNVDNRPPSSSIVANNFRALSKDSFKFTQPADGGTYYSVQFNTLSVPVGYSYLLIEGLKWNIGLNATLTYNRLLNTNALMYDEQSGYYIRKQFTENSQLHKNTGMGSVGLDLNYRIDHALSVSLNPQVGRTLNSMESGAIHTGLKYWSIGAGFKWYLN